MPHVVTKLLLAKQVQQVLALQRCAANAAAPAAGITEQKR